LYPRLGREGLEGEVVGADRPFEVVDEAEQLFVGCCPVEAACGVLGVAVRTIAVRTDSRPALSGPSPAARQPGPDPHYPGPVPVA